MLSAAFGAGWFASPVRDTALVVSLRRADWQMLIALMRVADVVRAAVAASL